MTFYKHGYARAEAVNASYLSWEWVQCYSVVYDRMVITQDGIAWDTNTNSDDTTSSNNTSSLSPGVVVGVLLIVLIVIFAIGYFIVYPNMEKILRYFQYNSPHNAEDLNVLVDPNDLSSSVDIDSDLSEIKNIEMGSMLPVKANNKFNKGGDGGNSNSNSGDTKHKKNYEVASGVDV